jgi:transposase
LAYTLFEPAVFTVGMADHFTMRQRRQRFMELRTRGWSVRAAAREVGVSRSAATNWIRGYKA